MIKGDTLSLAFQPASGAFVARGVSRHALGLTCTHAFDNSILNVGISESVADEKVVYIIFRAPQLFEIVNFETSISVIAVTIALKECTPLLLVSGCRLDYDHFMILLHLICCFGQNWLRWVFFLWT